MSGGTDIATPIPWRRPPTGLVGGVADLGSIAAYPIYCFPNYGSCPVRWYRN
jgi:hypothetical protein